MDELAPDEDVFADDLLFVPDELAEDVAELVSATQFALCLECGSPLSALPGETEGGCENPFCSLAVNRTEEESMRSRPVLMSKVAA